METTSGNEYGDKKNKTTSWYEEDLQNKGYLKPENDFKDKLKKWRHPQKQKNDLKKKMTKHLPIFACFPFISAIFSLKRSLEFIVR